MLISQLNKNLLDFIDSKPYNIFTIEKNTMNLSKLYTKYNWKFFKGKLENIPIIEISLSNAYGYTIPDWSGMFPECILIDKSLSKREKRMTLAHEMVHVWQAHKEYKSWAHNKKFNRKARKICKKMNWKFGEF